MWHDGWHSFLRCQSENPFACFGAKPTQRACARDLPRDRKRTREGMSQRSSQQKGAEEDSRQEKAAKRRSVKRWEQGREETSRQKSERRLLGPVDPQMPGWPMREDESAFLVACGSFTRIHTRDSLQKHGEQHKVLDFYFLRLELTQARDFLPPFRLCILCVGKGMWNTPGQRWEEPLDDSNGYE